MRWSDAEKETVAAAAATAGLAPGAWLGVVALDAAEHRAAAVPAVYRALLGELARVSSRLEAALSVLAPDGPPSSPAAAACLAAAQQADAAARRVSRALTR